jgi:RNA polymerase sigma-70 factor (sigma-E family)
MRDENEFIEFAAGATRPLLSLGWLLTGHHEQAQDLAQSALARTYSAWQRIKHDDAIGYARKVLVNLHTDWLRRRPWREQSHAEPPEPPPSNRTDDHGTVEDRLALVAALQSLTRRERATIVLRYYADLSEIEAARTMGVSTGTIKSVSARALRKLRENPALEGFRIPTATAAR